MHKFTYKFLKDKTNLFGYHWLIGDLTGYNVHYKWFGEKTKATPDGRFSGEQMQFGLGQGGGKDRVLRTLKFPSFKFSETQMPYTL